MIINKLKIKTITHYNKNKLGNKIIKIKIHYDIKI